jgi:hypothetical protein
MTSPGPDQEREIMASMEWRRLLVSLRAGQYDGLRKLKRMSGAPIAELVRRAVDVYLVRRLQTAGNSESTLGDQFDHQVPDDRGMSQV